MQYINVQTHWLHQTPDEILEAYNRRHGTNHRGLELHLFLCADDALADEVQASRQDEAYGGSQASTEAGDEAQGTLRWLHVRRLLDYDSPYDPDYDRRVPCWSLTSDADRSKSIVTHVLDKLRLPIQKNLIKDIQLPEFAWDRPQMDAPQPRSETIRIVVMVFAFHHFDHHQDAWDHWADTEGLGRIDEPKNVRWELPSGQPFDAHYNVVIERYRRHIANDTDWSIARGSVQSVALMLRHFAFRVCEEGIRRDPSRALECVLFTAAGGTAELARSMNIFPCSDATLNTAQMPGMACCFLYGDQKHRIVGWWDRRTGHQDICILSSPWMESFFDDQTMARIGILQNYPQLTSDSIPPPSTIVWAARAESRWC